MHICPVSSYRCVTTPRRQIKLPAERRKKSSDRLTDKELHDYRSIVGQLAWPARETMPQLAYLVSDLQQVVNQSTVADLVHADVGR